MIDKPTLIEQLTKRINFIESILEKQNTVSVFEKGHIDKLNILLNKNRDYLYRLNKDDIEIAIIGLEKSGKSTFANALLESHLLPSSTERCTFTSTSIKYSSLDKVVIQFYTEDEFNEQFKALLWGLNCPTELIVDDFKQFNFEAFDVYFQNLKEENNILYKNHASTTYLDIKDILEYKDSFHLTGKEITLESYLESQIIEYITGKEISNGRKNTALPRSVKKIDIYTTKLNQLKNGVIYDVPGFDSPIHEHQEQTRKQLNSADIIVLVTDVTKPTLTSPSLKILNESDEKGILLKDKLFIFGNRLDKANSFEEAENNIKKLIESVKQNDICDTDRIFCGSALRYLIEKGIILEKISASLNIKQTGLQEVRDALISYNRIHRLNIINKNVNESNIELKNLCQFILEKHAEILNSSLRGDIKKIENKILNNLQTGINNARDYISKQTQDKKLSNEFIKELDSNSDKLVSLDDIEKIRKMEAITIGDAVSISHINNKLRRNKHIEIQNNFSLLFEELEKNSMQEAVKTIIDSISSEFISFKNKKEIQQVIENFVNENMSESRYNAKFECLFERFSRHLFDMFAFPLNDPGRREKFRQAKADFLYLDSYYSKKKNNGYSLIKIILTQKESDKNIRLISNIDNIINEFISTEAKIVQTGMNIFNHVGKILNRSNDSDRNLLKSFYEYFIKDPQTLDLDVDSILNDADIPKNQDDIISEINRDIHNIKDILKNAVVEAMDLELVFFNSIDKNIQKLLGIITSVHSNQSPIEKILELVQDSELGVLKQDREILEILKNNV